MNESIDPSAAPAATWQPKIVAFFCNWCTYTAADLAGVSRMKYASNARIIRLMCSGRVDPQFILEAFAKGADGVLIGGCHPGDCHYVEGNFKTLRRFQLLKRLLRDMGIEEERLRLAWISAAEGEKVKTVINDMVEKLRVLGPLALPNRFAEWDKEVIGSERISQPREAVQPDDSVTNEAEVAHVS
ncbi:MAG: hydrogenase iron-sulfur subunit [Verrucomicrobia bacterium]|nr:hydrogenase iron-sulfur subunit [Verrucomicrobiota bacterium]